MSTAPVGIALVEDNAGDARLIQEMLSEPPAILFRMVRSTRLADVLERLAAERFEVVLLDLDLPDSHGLETLDRVKARAPKVPIIIFSGANDEDLAARAVANGAQDYLVKGQVSPFLLKRSIRYAVERKRTEERIREAEANLRASETRLHQLLSSSSAVIYATAATPNGIAPSWVSENIARIMGHDLQVSLEPGWWIEHVHPEDRDRILGRIPEVLHQGQLTSEYRFRYGDGIYRWIRDDSRLVPGAGAGESEVVGVWLDITESKQAEEALRARGRQQAAVAELGQHAIETPDVARAFDAAMTLVARTLDVEFSEVLELLPDRTALVLRAGVGWREGCVGEATVPSDTTSQAGCTLVANEPVIVGDLATETRFANNALRREHHIVSGVTVVIPGQTRPFGVLGAHSARPRRFTQDDIHFLKAVAHVLGQVVDREHTENALRQTQRLEAVGRLAGGVAHDFNNLLTAISGYSQLMLADLPEENPLREDAEEIHKAAGRAASLTRQLLAFSRQQVLQPRVISLNDAVADMERMLRRLIGEDIELETTLSRELGLVKADPGQIEQVIMNLVVNARDAMPDGGKITLETAPVDLDQDYTTQFEGVRAGSYAMVAVSDTGIGMDRETQARIFEPFFTTKGADKGTGLGLATVYGIVKQSGGHIWVYSEPGRGTTVKIYLPEVVDEEDIATKPAEAPARPTAQGETILLVEDEAVVRKLAHRLLAQAGYHVLVAANGDEALQLSARHQGVINLVVTDVVMPQLGGPALASRLAATRPEVRVLYLSGYTDHTVRKGFLDGDVAFLQKPFSNAALVRKVRETLDGAGV